MEVLAVVVAVVAVPLVTVILLLCLIDVVLLMMCFWEHPDNIWTTPYMLHTSAPEPEIAPNSGVRP